VRIFSRTQRHTLNTTWMVVSLVLLALLPFLLFTGLYLKSFLLLRDYNVFDLLFGREWKPAAGKFGFYPFIIGSVWVTLFAMLISAPICILTAIYVTQ
jgi:phosphate transport system permease protein